MITGDEICFNMIPKADENLQWKQPTSPRPKKARMSKLHTKTMLIIVFDIRGTVHFEFIPHGQTVNQVYYVEILKRLLKVRRR